MDQKQAYEQKIKSRLEELEARINLVKSKAHQVSADAQVEYTRKAGELSAKAAAVRSQLGELASSGADTWEKVRDRIEESSRQLKQELEKLTA